MKRVLYLMVILIISCSKETDIVSPSELDFIITIIAGEGGTVSSQGGVFPEGTEISVEAIPNSNYTFDTWSDGSTDNPKIILVTAEISFTANFIFNCINNAPQIDLNNTSYDLFDIKYPLSDQFVFLHKSISFSDRISLLPATISPVTLRLYLSLSMKYEDIIMIIEA